MTGTGPTSAIIRRRLLLASGAAVAAGVVGTAGALLPRQRHRASEHRPAQAARPAPTRAAVTTLETSARLGGPSRPGGYRRLVSGPGRPAGVREEPAAARTGREDRRTPLACFVQFTDPHLADVQNPLRTEFLRARSATA